MLLTKEQERDLLEIGSPQPQPLLLLLSKATRTENQLFCCFYFRGSDKKAVAKKMGLK